MEQIRGKVNTTSSAQVDTGIARGRLMQKSEDSKEALKVATAMRDADMHKLAKLKSMCERRARAPDSQQEQLQGMVQANKEMQDPPASSPATVLV